MTGQVARYNIDKFIYLARHLMLKTRMTCIGVWPFIFSSQIRVQNICLRLGNEGPTDQHSWHMISYGEV